MMNATHFRSHKYSGARYYVMIKCQPHFICVINENRIILKHLETSMQSTPCFSTTGNSSHNCKLNVSNKIDVSGIDDADNYDKIKKTNIINAFSFIFDVCSLTLCSNRKFILVTFK